MTYDPPRFCSSCKSYHVFEDDECIACRKMAEIEDAEMRRAVRFFEAIDHFLPGLKGGSYGG